MVEQLSGIFKQSRACRPKVRTGCRTCKKRRVKCDEAKPDCMRCHSAGWICDGYDRDEKKSSSIQPLTPRASRELRVLFYNPSTTQFTDELEHRYFQVFCDKTARELSGYFESDLWNRLILQACDQDSSIRHAVVAIAALDCTSQSFQGTKQLKGNGDASTYHEFALRQYSKAITQMREATLSGEQDLRMTLITCIVIICFETFHGNHESAVAQVHTGLQLMEGLSIPNRKPICDSRSVSYATSGVIEDELVEAFGRLDIQAMSFVDSRTAETHLHMQKYGQATLASMPAEFTTIKEARTYLELVMQRLLHFSGSASEEYIYQGCLGSAFAELPASMISARDGHFFDLLRWHKAFKSLLSKARRFASKDFLAATALQLHYLPSYFSLASFPTPNRRFPQTRQFMPVFREMVSHAKTLLQHPDAPRRCRFTFDLQVIVPLYVVACRCPHKIVRRQAISLLLSSPRREGLWDGILAGKLAEWIMSIEEEHIIGDYVPEDSKVSSVNITFLDMRARIAHVQCKIPCKGSLDLVLKETVISW